MALTSFTDYNPITFASASSAATNAPASNLAVDTPEMVWRTTAAGAQYVIFSQVGSVDTIALLFSNLRSTDTWRVRANNTADPTTSPLYDSGTIAAYTGNKTSPHRTKSIITLGAPVTYTTWRIDITATSHPDGYVEASRLILGQRYTTTRDMDWGCSYSWSDPSVAYSGPSYEDFDQFAARPQWKISFSYIPMAHWKDTLAPALGRVGQWKPVLFIPQTDDATSWQNEAVYGRFQQGQEGSCAYYDGWYTELTCRGLTT